MSKFEQGREIHNLLIFLAEKWKDEENYLEFSVIFLFSVTLPEASRRGAHCTKMVTMEKNIGSFFWSCEVVIVSIHTHPVFSRWPHHYLRQCISIAAQNPGAQVFATSLKM